MYQDLLIDEMIDSEDWAEVPFARDYLVSVFGEVYNLNTNRFLKPSGRIYSLVGLRTNQGNNRSFGLHVVVASTFITNPYPSRIMVNHIDLDKKNNQVDNLEWVTHGENIDHWMAVRDDCLDEYYALRRESRLRRGEEP